MPAKDYDTLSTEGRSGKQNIAEGCAARTMSSETELKLLNVAKASLQELLVDYEDYLRVRGLKQWQMTDEQYLQSIAICRSHNDSAFYREKLSERSDEAVAVKVGQFAIKCLYFLRLLGVKAALAFADGIISTLLKFIYSIILLCLQQNYGV